MRSPIIRRNPADRTGVGKLVKSAQVEIDRRYKGIEAEVLGLLAGIPVWRVNAVDLALRDESLARQVEIATALAGAVDRWLSIEQQPLEFWYGDYDQKTIETGTTQTQTNLSGMSEIYAAARPVETIIYSEPYQNRVKLARTRSYEHWKSLSATAKSELTDIVLNGIAQGRGIKVVQREIQERLGVNKSRAQLYAQTDMTNTLREAKLAEVEQTREQLGLKVELLWTSAFLPTTRPWHASRHGSTYTVEQVQHFYSQSRNKYNCFCAVTEVLIDDKGKPLLTEKVQKLMDVEREKWFDTHVNKE